MPEFTPARLAQIRAIDIKPIDLGPKAESRLRAEGINTLGDLEKCAGVDRFVSAWLVLADIQGFGPWRIAKVRYALSRYGLRLRDEVR